MSPSLPPLVPPAITQSLPCRLDSEKEEELLKNRIEWSRKDQLGDQVPRQSMGLLGDVARLKQGEIGDGPDYPDLFYRLHSCESHTFYSNGEGFQCARWILQRDSKRPSAQDSLDHCNGEKNPSPFVFMAESPWRLLRLERKESSAHNVFIIDAKRLRATEINVQRTTQLAQQWNLRYTGGKPWAQVQFVTETHWVAEDWIPHD